MSYLCVAGLIFSFNSLTHSHKQLLGVKIKDEDQAMEGLYFCVILFAVQEIQRLCPVSPFL